MVSSKEMFCSLPLCLALLVLIAGHCKADTCPDVKPGLILSCYDECSSNANCTDKTICCANGCAKICRYPEVEAKKDSVSPCEIARMKAQLSLSTIEKGKCAIQYVPSCDDDRKTWSREQCHESLGVCWCATDKGSYIPNSMRRGKANCDGFDAKAMEMADSNPQDLSTVDFEVCPNNEKVHCCSPSLCDRKCRFYPETTCRVNPCNGCKAEYFDYQGSQVVCEKAFVKPCEREVERASDLIQEHIITEKIGKLVTEKVENKDIATIDQYITKLGPVTASSLPSSGQTAIPATCMQRPDAGECNGFLPRWYYEPNTRKCSMFIWGMCGGNGNRFKSAEECYSFCDPNENPCNGVRCDKKNPACFVAHTPKCYEGDTLCHVVYTCANEKYVNQPKGLFVPSCNADGYYNFKQCHQRYCWCVKENGEYNGGLTKLNYRVDLQCNSEGPITDKSNLHLKACENGLSPNPKCLKACTGKVCLGHPDAECRVDLCSDTCKTRFVGSDGDDVECGDDKCQAFTFDPSVNEECKPPLCNGQEPKTCPIEVCDKMECSKNPCARCKVDPCTCTPYFVDIMTGKRVPDDECKYVLKGLCHIKACSLLHQAEKAKLKGVDVTDVDLPQCEENGRFKPMQCRDRSFDCFCVNRLGIRTFSNPYYSPCHKLDTPARVNVSLTFDGDFEMMEKEGKLNTFKDALTQELVAKLAIAEKYVDVGEPYDGSVKVDVVVSRPQNAPDMEVVINNLEQAIDTSDLKVKVGDDELTVDPSRSSVEKIYVRETNDGADGDDGDGLSEGAVIAIAIVACIVVAIIVAVVVYFCCCKRKSEAIV